jgi:hypothetical protein
MARSARDSAAHLIQIVAYVDDDDPAEPSGAEIVIRGPRIVMSDMWNECAKRATGDILMMCADDVIFPTHGWDGIVESAFASVPDRILFAFGDDGGGGGRSFGTLGFIHRRWYEAVGYFVPSGFTGDYSDTWLNDVANMIGRHRFVDIKTEHLHPLWNKAPMDQTYKEKYERDVRNNSTKMYAERFPERERDAQKLRSVML